MLTELKQKVQGMKMQDLQGCLTAIYAKAEKLDKEHEYYVTRETQNLKMYAIYAVMLNALKSCGEISQAEYSIYKEKLADLSRERSNKVVKKYGISNKAKKGDPATHDEIKEAEEKANFTSDQEYPALKVIPHENKV